MRSGISYSLRSNVGHTFLENFEMFEEDVADEWRSTTQEFVSTELQ